MCRWLRHHNCKGSLVLWILLGGSNGVNRGFPGGSVVKNPPAKAGNAGEASSVPGWGRSPGGGNGNPLQYSCLENPMDRGAWQRSMHSGANGVAWGAPAWLLRMLLEEISCCAERAKNGIFSIVGLPENFDKDEGHLGRREADWPQARWSEAPRVFEDCNF